MRYICVHVYDVLYKIPIEMNNTLDKKQTRDSDAGEEIYSQVVRAGRRTYFFDVKATKEDDYYLIITESRKKEGKDGEFFYSKNKIFLFKEDFDKYLLGLENVINYIKQAKPEAFLEREKETVEEIVF